MYIHWREKIVESCFLSSFFFLFSPIFFFVLSLDFFILFFLSSSTSLFCSPLLLFSSLLALLLSLLFLLYYTLNLLHTRELSIRLHLLLEDESTVKSEEGILTRTFITIEQEILFLAVSRNCLLRAIYENMRLAAFMIIVFYDYLKLIFLIVCTASKYGQKIFVNFR